MTKQVAHPFYNFKHVYHIYQIDPKLPHIFLLKRMISSLEILDVANATSAFSASN